MEKVVATHRTRGANSRAAREPPTEPRVRVASLDSSRLLPASLARRASMACAGSGHGLGRLPGTGSASMPTLWSVNLREPFGCASPYRAVQVRRRGDSLLTSSESRPVGLLRPYCRDLDSDISLAGSSRLGLP